MNRNRLLFMQTQILPQIMHKRKEMIEIVCKITSRKLMGTNSQRITLQSRKLYDQSGTFGLLHLSMLQAVSLCYLLFCQTQSLYSHTRWKITQVLIRL